MRVCVCTRASLLVCIYIYDFIMYVYVCVSVYACACPSLCEMSEYASVCAFVHGNVHVCMLVSLVARAMQFTVH